MKIIMFQGGLGNQLFEYEYYLYLRKEFPREKIYGFYYKRWLKDHNGLEIDKWFDVELPQSNFISHSISLILFYIARLLYKFKIRPFFINYKFEVNDNAFFQEGFWQDKKFMSNAGLPAFKSNLFLDDKNKKILAQIDSLDSVSIHIRRGDYLSHENKEIFGDICTENYYRQCIEKAKQQFTNPVFFIFSNDMDYAKNLFPSDAEYVCVENNKGSNSFFDMYLMAHCKGMILANSTFSCWAAYLNRKSSSVWAPSRWVNKGVAPDVNLGHWTVIDIPLK